MLCALVNLNREGVDIGSVEVPIDESWIVLPPDIARNAIKLEDGNWTLDDLDTGELVVLIRVVGGNAEFFIGSRNDSEAKMREHVPGSLGGRASVSFDSYVLKADGSVEH